MNDEILTHRDLIGHSLGHGYSNNCGYGVSILQDDWCAYTETQQNIPLNMHPVRVLNYHKELINRYE